MAAKGDNNVKKRNKKLNPKTIIPHLDHAYQKSKTQYFTMQNILMLLCPCIYNLLEFSVNYSATSGSL